MTAVREWFRTRWAALWWPYRVMFAGFIVLFVVFGEWVVLLGLPAWFYIVADWQYWQRRCEVGGPFTLFGLAVFAKIQQARQRGEAHLTIHLDGDQWGVGP